MDTTPAMVDTTAGHWPIRGGMTVYGADGDKVGKVTEVGAAYITVEQGFFVTTDYYAPTSAIAAVGDREIHLTVPRDEVVTPGLGPEAGRLGYRRLRRGRDPGRRVRRGGRARRARPTPPRPVRGDRRHPLHRRRGEHRLRLDAVRRVRAAAGDDAGHHRALRPAGRSTRRSPTSTPPGRTAGTRSWSSCRSNDRIRRTQTPDGQHTTPEPHGLAVADPPRDDRVRHRRRRRSARSSRWAPPASRSRGAAATRPSPPSPPAPSRRAAAARSTVRPAIDGQSDLAGSERHEQEPDRVEDSLP